MLCIMIVIVVVGGLSVCLKLCNCMEKMISDKLGIIVDCKDKCLLIIFSEFLYNIIIL